MKTSNTPKKHTVSTFYAIHKRYGSNEVFWQLLEDWLNSCKVKGLSAKSVYDYSDKSARFLWWWITYTGYGKKLGNHPRYVTVQEAKEYASFLRSPLKNRWSGENDKEELTNATIASYGRVVIVFFNWLEREGHIERSPFTSGKVTFNRGSKKKDKIIKNVNTENLARIFQALTNPEQLKTFVGIRDLAMFSLLLDSGMRRGELLSMEMTDLDMAKMRCTVRGKTGQRYAHFSERCKGLLLDYLKARNEEFEGTETALWVTADGKKLGEDTFYSTLRRIEKRSGVDFHPHQLRHTFALLMSQKVSVFELRDLLGHSSIKTTEIYVQQNPERLAAIYQTASPLTTMDAELPGLRRKGRPRKNY